MKAVSLDGRRVLVIGASSGIGRGFAIAAVRSGAEVGCVARRAGALAETIEIAGGGTAITADLRKPDDCARIGVAAKALLGEVDLVFVSSGSSNLSWLERATAEDWSVALETNVIGINLAIRALLPALARSAVVAVCSSETVGHPHAGLIPYGASKAALEESIRGWRLEHPEYRFSCVAIGASYPTSFADSWDREMLQRAMEAWTRQGVSQSDLMDSDDVANVLARTYGIALAFPGIGIEHITLRSPAPLVDDVSSVVDAVEARSSTEG